MDTDYTSYAIVYSCSGYYANTIVFNFLWILSREALVEGTDEFNAFETKVYGIIKQKLPDFDFLTMETTVQGGQCVYPEVK